MEAHGDRKGQLPLSSLKCLLLLPRDGTTVTSQMEFGAMASLTPVSRRGQVCFCSWMFHCLWIKEPIAIIISYLS